MLITGGYWARFLDLIKGPPKLSGEVAAVGSGGYYTVTLLGGGEVEVQGTATYTVGQKVFVRGNLIEGLASTLTPVVIDI